MPRALARARRVRQVRYLYVPSRLAAAVGLQPRYGPLAVPLLILPIAAWVRRRACPRSLSAARRGAPCGVDVWCS
jgi:hypothetical protein